MAAPSILDTVAQVRPHLIKQVREKRAAGESVADITAFLNARRVVIDRDAVKRWLDKDAPAVSDVQD